MRPQIISKTGTGASSPIVVNTNVTPVNIGYGVVVTGTVTYTVQASYDDPVTGFTTWFDDATATGKTANFAGNVTTPISGLRLNVTAGTGTATMTAVQAGIA